MSTNLYRPRLNVFPPLCVYALGHAGLSASQVSRFRIEFDRDDGRSVYEIEFNNGRTEYEYEIDASIGVILEYSSEYDD